MFHATDQERKSSIKFKNTRWKEMRKTGGDELLPWDGKEDWASPSEHPCTLTERAMQRSVLAGKAKPGPLDRIDNPSAAITPAEKGEPATKFLVLPPSNTGIAGEYNE